jgi:hypothetical protein
MRALRKAAAAGALVVAALTIVGTSAASADSGRSSTPPGGSSTPPVTPILECVFHDTKTGQYNSLWGYNNTSTSTQSIAAGSTYNFFYPSPYTRGQPGSFAAGRHDNVFTVTWNGSSTIYWGLGSGVAYASTTSPACRTNPVPITGTDLPWWVLPLAFLGLAMIGITFCARRYGLDLTLSRSSASSHRD